jgi:hypothetical protein
LIPTDPDQLLIILGAFVVVVEAVFLVYLRPSAGAWMLAIAAALNTYSNPSGIVVAGFQVYPLDAVTVVLGLVVVARLVLRPRLNRAIGLLIVLLGVALLRGISEFDAQVAINASRGLLQFLAALAFAFVCLRETTWIVVQRIWRWLAVAFMVTAAIFLARHGFGTYASSGERALISAQALIVGQAGVMALVTSVNRLQRLFAAACFLTLLVSQQRTVWGATIATALVLAIGSGRLGNRQVARSVRVGLAVVGFGVVAVLTAGPTTLQRSVTQATSSASTDSGTLGWRVQGWVSLLDGYSAKPPEDKLLGQPFGTGFARAIDKHVITVSPHNMYITVLLSLGAVGLAALLIIFAAALRRSAKTSMALVALVVGLMVYSIGYQLFSVEGLLIGAALTYSGQSNRLASADISTQGPSAETPLVAENHS